MSKHTIEEMKNICALKMVKIIADFQYLERELKNHISSKYEVIKTIINNKVPFNFSGENLKKKTLGALVSELSTVSNNYEMINELKVIVKARNEIAHERFLFITQSDDILYLKKTYNWLCGLERDLESIMIKYIAEMSKSMIVHNDALKERVK